MSIKQKEYNIGILTFHRALSYGAVLQTWALTQELKSLGYQVQIINYCEPFIFKRPTGIWSFKKMYNLNRFRKELVFRNFRKKRFLNVSKKINNVQELKSSELSYDVLVVGSDQVWNSRLTGNSLYVYFLSTFSTRKISYAASFGTDDWKGSVETTEEVKALLSDFDALSVRENSGRRLLQEVFHQQSSVVLDPTLVWSDYSDMINSVPHSNYIFCFKVNYDSLFMEKAMEIGAYLQKQVVFIGESKSITGSISVKNPSVEDWLSLMYHADFVFTDSFHGLAFSLNFKKDFLMYNSNKHRFTRISSLLLELSLENRIFSSEVPTQELVSSVNYNLVNGKLRELRERSKSFLHKNICNE